MAGTDRGLSQQPILNQMAANTSFNMSGHSIDNPCVNTEFIEAETDLNEITGRNVRSVDNKGSRSVE